MAIWIALSLSLTLGLVSHFVFDHSNSLPGELLRYVMLVSNGAILVITSGSHLFRPELMARELGWPPGGPFQKVVGFWNLGVGSAAIMSFWRGGDFLLAVAFTTVVFWAGAAMLHWQAGLGGAKERLLTAVGETALVITLLILLTCSFFN